MTNALRLELAPKNIRVSALYVAYTDTGMTKGFDAPKLDPADIASLALDGMAADEYEIIADDLSRQVQADLAGGAAALYPDLPQKPTWSPATPLSCVTHAAAWPAEDVADKLLRDPAASSDSELVRRELRRRKRLDYTPSVAPEPRPNTKVH